MGAFAERALVALMLAGCQREKAAEPIAKPVVPAKAPVPHVDRSSSVVTVVCPSSSSFKGFFVAPDRVATRAPMPCEQPSVKLFDGRTLLARGKLPSASSDFASSRPPPARA